MKRTIFNKYSKCIINLILMVTIIGMLYGCAGMSPGYDVLTGAIQTGTTISPGYVEQLHMGGTLQTAKAFIDGTSLTYAYYNESFPFAVFFNPSSGGVRTAMMRLSKSFEGDQIKSIYDILTKGHVISYSDEASFKATLEAAGFTPITKEQFFDKYPLLTTLIKLAPFGISVTTLTTFWIIPFSGVMETWSMEYAFPQEQS